MSTTGTHLGQYRGTFDPAGPEISLLKGAPGTQTVATLIHEILEAVNSIYNLNISHDILDILDIGLAQALGPILERE